MPAAREPSPRVMESQRNATRCHGKPQQTLFLRAFRRADEKNVREGITSMCPMVINHIGKITNGFRRCASAAQYG
jgi:hypothetical protein